ncbi:hypothetical protein WJX81_003668 [Elliptochloris bilobata]|uniref:Uncharacterized protein n=1 Tax=Elliptochloris bilobata TaxID=381761 RepID=A0AAW1QKJ9_9CHLO
MPVKTWHGRIAMLPNIITLNIAIYRDPDPYNMDGGYWTLAGLQALAGVGLTGYLPLDPLSQPRHQAPYL